ncbi:peptidase [Sporosarcina sp. P12(2017)]|uniref:SepM family pheromone-processing serine protease n=1 Tax=unclassified Sporosarcina TaxID=2647733 RepID=UPI000C16B0B0|nr:MULTISPECIES: SepM family pheromone-processing serine protease [unclassified Sporosarcina]PIC58881.1 peptidase [Sporosarcina sp. P10]PIC62201.1 peptidase [Sporosarcina sp. P12(2017)]
MKMRKWAIAAVILLVVVVLALYPLDMYISRPGGAYDLAPLVEVVGGDTDDVGTFSLMTIAIGKATPVTYAWSKFSDKMKLMPATQVRRHGESDEEYGVRQIKLMADSKTHAISVAFDKAGLPINRKFTGVFVAGVLPAGASAGKLKVGDVIQSIDQQKLASTDAFIQEISGMSKGQNVHLQVERGERKVDVPVELKELPETDGRVGLGIEFEEQVKLETEPKVDIRTEEIGGPSAGLMFTLELMNRLVDVDLTKGYNIAGTGEMLEDGSVGRIGGIDFKIIAADREGIEIFFAPDDELPEEVKKKNPQLLSNYDEAKATADKIGAKMKVVPVKTIDDALSYLEKLEEK